MVSAGNQLTITNTPGAIINWQSFSINAGEVTRFIQQNSQSTVLNRVVGQDPSQILGALQSNGKVFVINPNGILFGAGAQVDVNGLVASSLKLSNEDFLVSSMIERCPKTMMLRELVKNALESASSVTNWDARIEIGTVTVEGTAKLAIWNTGPGMDADELYRMCDLASSIGKENALDQNFGMGAKVASLPSNHHGIRYRSCKAGR